MPIPASGPLSMTDIQTEFGGTNPIGLNEYYAGGANVPAGTSGTYGAVPSSGAISIQNFYGTTKLVPGSVSFTTAGTYSWVAPSGVTKVSVVAVGGGARTGAGLGYKNNVTVTPGSSYTVVVGDSTNGSANGGDSFFINTSTVRGGGGLAPGTCGGTFTGDGGGNGGGGCFSGGGAGGYSGTGGNGFGAQPATPGSGGGGGGGFVGCCPVGGGGVGLFGRGATGAGGGGGGSGGTNGTTSAGGVYGGGAGFGRVGGRGAVRILWPGDTRTFPTTCVGAP